MSLSSLKGNLISYDTETTGLNPWGTFQRYGYYPARPFAFAFYDKFGNSAYIRWEVDPKTRKVIPEKQSKKAMCEILGDPSIVKVGHNLSFDIRMTLKSGIKFDWTKIHDTQFMAHVFTGGGLMSYALKPLAKLWLNIGDEDQKDLLASVMKARRLAKKNGWFIAQKETHGNEPLKSDYWLGDKNLCQKYALQDAERTMLIYLGLVEQFKNEPKLWKIYEKEIRLSKAVYRMEKNGIRVDAKHLIELRKFYTEYSDKWLAIAKKNGGKDLNFNSPKQMVEKFCVEKKYKTRKQTNSGQPSIDNSELERLAKKDKLAKAILEHKAGNNMMTKFINPYERFMVKDGIDWVLHPNFRQCGPITGRFSCSDPNLMQVAAEDSVKKKAEIGLKPREAFGPRKDTVWYLPDFSQMEVWVFAFQAKDKTMTQALLSGEDFHMVTARQVWGEEKDWEQNQKQYRKKGKTMMFLKQYGGTSKAGAELMDCTRYEAQLAIDKFDERLPGVNEFLKKMMNKAENDGFVENPFGRRYAIDKRFSYKAVNYLVQGTCADIMKNAMIRLDRLFRKNWTGCKLLLTLHDELIIEVPKNLDCQDLRQDIILEMQKDSKRVGVPVSLPVTMKLTSTRWSDAKEI